MDGSPIVAKGVVITDTLYWLELAAHQGHADAMHWLGRCYIEGNGLPKNAELGIMWLSKAAAHGHIIARYQMDRLYALKK